MTPTPPRKLTRPMLGLAAVGAAIAVPLLIFGGSTADAADGQLRPFADCEEFVRAARQSTLDQIMGTDGRGGVTTALDDLAARTAAPAAETAAGVASAYSTTNVQVAGVDEPDIVKTDGTRVFAIAKGRVYAVDMTGPSPVIAGSLALPEGLIAQEMLLSGNRLVVIATGAGMIEPAVDVPAGIPTPRGGFGFSGTAFVDVDVSDAANMRRTNTLRVEASYVSARLTGSTARVVLNADPLSRIALDAGDPDAMKRAIADAGASQWIPTATLTRADGSVESQQALVACTAISRPGHRGPLGMLNLITMDLSQGVTPTDSDAVLASGWTVMASPSRIYVALGHGSVARDRYVEATDVHVFDTSSPNRTDYRASGSVEGSLLNQFSMSEYDDRLRIATTLSSFAVSPLPAEDAVANSTSIAPPAQASESAVTVLEQRGDRLSQVGRVTGLGKGERIYAVRFLGDRGYVVTFRQTDPLYTVDLSDPTAPRVAGELKIPGYSSYLHPVNETTLIGVGQDADAQGQVRGLQVGLFDVTDPANPTRTQVWSLPTASSEAEYDHHAFLWWAPSSTVVLPVAGTTRLSIDAATGATEPVQGTAPMAVALRVTPDAITPTGRITHPGSDAGQIRRSLVVGQSLLTISDAGVAIGSLDGATTTHWLKFA